MLGKTPVVLSSLSIGVNWNVNTVKFDEIRYFCAQIEYIRCLSDVAENQIRLLLTLIIDQLNAGHLKTIS